MSVLVAVLGLALLIFIHEGGHFLTALAVRMRPRSFNVGFGPPLLKVRRRGVEYAVRSIPLGGYVKIPGMHRAAPADVDAHFARAVQGAPFLLGPTERLKRALAAGDDRAALEELDALEREAARGGVSGLERGLGELRDALSPEAYWRQRPWKKVCVIVAGPATNLVFAVAMFAVVYMVAGGRPTTTVEEVFAGRPAAAMGLRPHDRILAVDGRPVEARDITRAIAGSQGRPLVLTVRRDGRTLTLGPARPRLDQGVYRLGFRLAAEPLGTAESLWQALKLTAVVSRETAKSLATIVRSEGRENVSGPVGIVRESSRAAEAGWPEYLGILGFVSLSLALLNLLPLLPLDGGHIAFSLVEAVRRRAVSREIYERVSAVGIAAILLLFFIGLSNDVNRLGGG